MKEETVVYIRVPASEVPEKDGEYNTSHGDLSFEGGIWLRWITDQGHCNVIKNLKWWLKPTPLSSLLQEGAHIYAYDIIRVNKPWNLRDILGKLIYATNHLLSKEDYDKHGWEEVSHAVKEAEKVHNILESTHSDDLRKTISVQEGAVEFAEWLHLNYYPATADRKTWFLKGDEMEEGPVIYTTKQAFKEKYGK